MRKIYLILLCALILPHAALTADFSLDTFKATLQAEKQSIAGHFVQERHLKNLAQPLRSSGHFVLVPEQILLWQLEKPFTLTLRVRSDGVAQQDAQGQWQPTAQNSRQMALFMALLGGDIAALQSEFTPNLSGNADNWQLQLTPKGALLQQIFTQIVLSGDTYVREVQLFETQGDRSVLQFLDLKLLPALPPSVQEALR